MKLLAFFTLMLASTTALAAGPASNKTEWPSESLFRIESAWKNQSGQPAQLSTMAGHPFVASMIYTRCLSACPLMVGDMKRFDQRLSKKEKTQVRYLLVSIDPQHDTPEKLQAFAKKMKLDDRWTLLTGSEADTRELAAVLGFQYKISEDEGISHSSSLYLVDQAGRVQVKKERENEYTEMLSTFRKDLKSAK